MAILDTMIAQSSRLGLPAQPRREQDAASFRQELMGALALFTGGRSLAHPGRRDTDKTDPHVTDTPPPALTAAPEPPTFREYPEHAEQKPALQGPAPQMGLLPVTQASQDWSTLLAHKDRLTRQALKEVEPTLQNAEQSLTRFLHLQARQSDKTRPRTDPATLLQGFSATMTARSILGLHAPSNSFSPHGEINRQTSAPCLPTSILGLHAPGNSSSSHGEINRQTSAPYQPTSILGLHAPGNSSSPRDDIGGQTSTPVQPIMPHLSTLSPHLIEATSGERNVSSAQQENPLKRLSLVLTHTEQTLSQMQLDPSPTSSSFIPNKSAFNQPAAQLVRHVEATPRSRHITTHNTTTHSPNIHITVQAGHSRPQDIARAVETSTIHALTRQTLTQTG
ncbi:hypothetical protein AL01_05390 [Bombella intestini]|uniref:Uncharacterized protein n=1 Tax=Bombella intestini TaxID=1539051 RepID=A0A1S8GPW3_9PROT|nr:hypothetical protein [Bombella intestini]OOL18247.1 hypothetical protein AL01_05390 [Bombella intestini]